MDHKRPSESDYTTSTNPERFIAVIEHAKNLISELESEFVIDRGEGNWSEDFPRLAEFNEDSVPPIRLTPSIGVPLVFGLASAPGVALRVGRNVELLFPDCRCDACNLGVDEMCDEIDFHVEAVFSGLRDIPQENAREKDRW